MCGHDEVRWNYSPVVRAVTKFDISVLSGLGGVQNEFKEEKRPVAIRRHRYVDDILSPSHFVCRECFPDELVRFTVVSNSRLGVFTPRKRASSCWISHSDAVKVQFHSCCQTQQKISRSQICFLLRGKNVE